MSPVVARIEDVLDLYAEQPNPKRPVVCLDESPTKLIGEVRQQILPTPGQPERYDCEYKRNGTANLFVVLDVHRPWRKVKVTDSRAAVDFAACMRSSQTLTFPMRSGSGSCWIARRRTHLAHSIRHYLGAKPDGSCAGSIPPLNIPRAGICFVDCKLGRHTDSSAQACCAGAAVAHDEQVV